MVTRSSVLALVLAVWASALLSACVGVVVGNAGFTDVAAPPLSKADVLSRFGPPVQKRTEGGLEVWAYRVTEPAFSKKAPATSTTSTAFFFVVPIASSTSHDENLRLFFRGERLVRAMERVDRSKGVCGPTNQGDRGCADLSDRKP